MIHDGPQLISIDECVDLIKSTESHGLIFFLGAGVSMDPPSECPSWPKFLELVLTSSYGAQPAIAPLYSYIQDRIRGIKPELLCQILHSNLFSDFFGFLDILYTGKPNANHVDIASVVNGLDVAAILTTNFDTHIEQAIEEYALANPKGGQGRYEVYSNSCPSRVLKSLSRDTSRLSDRFLFKLHGSIDDRASMIVTLRQAGQPLKTDLKDLINTALTSYTVVVAGYSGNDDDIFPAFLDAAKRTRRVFWMLFDRASLSENVRLLAAECPNCSLVDTQKESIFARLRGRQPETPPRQLESLQNRYLEKWASGISDSHWRNFYSELLLTLGIDAESAAVVANEAAIVARWDKDPLVVAKAHRIRAEALLRFNEVPNAYEALGEALDLYMQLGRNRDLVECLSLMAILFPPGTTWRGQDALVWCARLTGGTYDLYSLAKYNHAVGMQYLRGNRIALAEARLLVAGGYAKRAGDQITLARCLDSLSTAYHLQGEPKLATRSGEEARQIRAALGLQTSDAFAGQWHIVARCEGAAQVDLQKSIKGEAIIVILISLFLGGVGCLVTHDLLTRVLIFASVLVSGAVGKIWTARKAAIKYSPIDYT